jgi:hypothetical protein
MHGAKSRSARTGMYMGHRRCAQLHNCFAGPPLAESHQPPYCLGWVANVRTRTRPGFRARREKRPAGPPPYPLSPARRLWYTIRSSSRTFVLRFPRRGEKNHR